MHPTKSAMMRPAISTPNRAIQKSVITSTATKSTLNAAIAMLDRKILARWERIPSFT